MDNKIKIAVLTGSGISSESGIPTFRDAGVGLWENFDIKSVCTHDAWMKNQLYVNNFYNMLRGEYINCQPNDGHKLIAELEKDDRFELTVITQNVDNLHEKAGSKNIIHLHGEIMKCCAEDDVEDENYWVTLPQEGFGENGLEIPEDKLAGDGKKGLLRPYIVFFEEPVPRITDAISVVEDADIFLVVGTSLTVYPAASLLYYTKNDCEIYIVEPNDVESNVKSNYDFIHIKKTGSEGMREFIEILNEKY